VSGLSASRVKCSDIDDDLFMQAVSATAPMGTASVWRHRRAVHATLNEMLGTELPENLFLAKARKLGLKGKLMGCTDCTCRGDYHTPRECHANRCCCFPEYDWRDHPGYSPEWEADKAVPRDPEAFPRAVAAAAALLDLPSMPGLVPFDLSNPSRLIYPAGYVQPPTVLLTPRR
jgi:hypothetical protein